MPANEPAINIRKFLGLHNRERPVRLPDGALTQAINVNVDNNGGIETRRGYVAIPGLTNITAMYSPRNGEALYVVSNGQLKRVVSLQPLVTDLMVSGISANPVWWAEAGSIVFANGAFRGMLNGSVASPMPLPTALPSPKDDSEFDGLPGHSAALGQILAAQPSATDVICYHEGKLFAAEYDPSQDATAVWFSKPFNWGSFDLFEDFLMIPGRVLMMASARELVIGTDRAIWTYGQAMAQVAEYGVVPCQPVYVDSVAYFWSAEGLCKATPFENLTGAIYSVPPGDSAALTAVQSQGVDRIMVHVRGGGDAPNAY